MVSFGVQRCKVFMGPTCNDVPAIMSKSVFFKSLGREFTTYFSGKGSSKRTQSGFTKPPHLQYIGVSKNKNRPSRGGVFVIGKEKKF